jgi:hypothetical protein
MENVIKAYHQSEERYQGLKLEYVGKPELRKDVIKAYKNVSNQSGLTPVVYENHSMSESEYIYIEFHDDINRESGAFFTDMLNELGIKNCEAG